MKLEFLNIRDAAVQDFVLEHVNPADFRFDYTRYDALKLIEKNIYEQTAQLVGDLGVGIAFYCSEKNPKIIEPHIMGKGIFMREALRQGCEFAWTMGYEQVLIWTQHDSIARVAESCGFKNLGKLPAIHMEADKSLTHLNVLSFEKGQPYA